MNHLGDRPAALKSGEHSRPGRRLLFVAHSLAVGGVETMIVDLVRLLEATEYVPEVCVLEGGGSLESSLIARGTPVHWLGKRPGLDLSIVVRLRRLVRERGMTIVHSHNFAPWLFTALALRGIPEVHHVHTEHSGVPASILRHVAERWCSRVTGAVIAVSNDVKDLLVNRVGVAGSRIRVIRNGVSTVRFAPDPAVRERCRQGLGIPRDDVVIGIIARLAPVKAHQTLIGAFGRLQQLNSRATTLLIVGDGAERTTLQGLVKQLGLSAAVRFLGERHDTEELLAAMDIYALSSISEGMNLTLLEAMAAGLPIVATEVGGNPEIVEEGVTGFLVPSGDSPAMAARLDELLQHSELRLRMGAAARDSAVRRFDEGTMIEAYLATYRQGGAA